MGAYASTAVFTSNSPFAAVEYMDAHGGLITIDRSRVSYMSGDKYIRDAESPDFVKTINEVLA